VQEVWIERLRGAVGPANVRVGIDLGPYVVDGRTPDVAVFPGSPEEVVAVLAIAGDSETPVLPWGGGTAAGIGAPTARTGIVLGLSRMHRIVEHEPGDLTVTVEAGITMADLQQALRAQGQWLSLDPPNAERATLGGVIAADASGPRRHLYGTARDALIGVTVVTAEGAIVRGGGKVVKNVAGYDLPKLFIGTYGTLGVVVEATVRLRPLPDDERLLGVSVDRVKDAGDAVRALLGSDLVPNAVELLDGPAASGIGVGGGAGATLIVGFDGLAEQVAWQCEEVSRLVAPLGGRDVRALPAAVWPGLASAARAAVGVPAAVMRFCVLPMHVAELMEQGAIAARARGFQSAWAAHAGVGVVSAAVAPTPSPPDLAALTAVLVEWREAAHAGGGQATLEWAPLAVKAQVPAWDDPGAAGRIMMRIKRQLDPRNLLAPGRFVAGI